MAARTSVPRTISVPRTMAMAMAEAAEGREEKQVYQPEPAFCSAPAPLKNIGSGEDNWVDYESLLEQGTV